MDFRKIIVYFVGALFLFVGTPAMEASSIDPKDPESILTDGTLEARILTVSDIIDAKYTPVVKDRLKRYIFKYPAYTQILLGKQVLYFPYFEKKLAERGLPDDLKYLPIIESSLMPNARSRVGAVGLWQFMAGTAKLNGLKITSTIDERINPIKASEAAVQHLETLYAIYNDWALVLAAYNCGPGNVNRAIKRANSKNYWELQPYLPKETRDYVPKFIAATYIFKYYAAHGLQLTLPELDYQVTGTIKIYDRLAFEVLSEWTDIDQKVLKDLNPGFKRGYIPATHGGYEIVLPRRVMNIVRERLNHLQLSEEVPPIPTTERIVKGDYKLVSLRAYEGESVTDIANYYNLNDYNIKYWNQLSNQDEISEDRILDLFVFLEDSPLVEVKEYRQKRTTLQIATIPRVNFVEREGNRQLETIFSVVKPDPLQIARRNLSAVQINDRRKKIKLKKGQSLVDIVKHLPDLSVKDLLALNHIVDPRIIKPGMHLFIE